MNEVVKIGEAVAAFGAAPDPADFREVLTGMPAPVHVVATDGPAGLTGFTGTAFAAISDEPPTVMVSLNRASRQNAIFKRNGVFSVNLLAQDRADLAEVFAGRTGLALAERFDHGMWRRAATGAPVLADALVVLDCRLSEIVEVATHTLLIGTVAAAWRTEAPAASALFYGDRGYFTA